ncbi:TonB-dependent receptor domain-containing protein [Phenylobacterium sp.]|uniref:TonB-dependent receptor domain-containing protein n=1 Tax=Phenylobacterium sp. TaxID=1871053 RepID=UPI0035B17E0B
MSIRTKSMVFPLSVILAAAAGASAQAQSSGNPDGEAVSEVVVTGSRIARRDFVSESPIVTVGADRLERGGAVTPEGALNQLPQFTASATASSNLTSRGGQANANLRGLGQPRTLVLLDGRRLQPSNSDGSVDLNTIPDSLIENVEVITGGASAVYGSDAIAGVVNFRLKRNFDGLELKAQYGVTEEGDGETLQLSSVLGGRFADDRGQAVLGLSYTDRKPVMMSDRDFFRISSASANLPEGVIRPDAANLPTQAAVNAIFGRYGIAPGTVPRSNTLGFNSDGTLFSAASPALNFRDDLGNLVFTLNNTYFYNTGQVYYLQLPLTRYSVFGRASYDVTSSVQAYAQAYFTSYEAETQVVAPVAGGATAPRPLTIPYNNPFVPADVAALLASRPNPTAPFLYSTRMNEVGLRVQSNDWTVYQITLGAAGKLPVRDWTFDVFGTRGETRYQETNEGYPSLSALERLLNAPDGGRSLCAGGYNPFGLRTLSVACHNYLARTIHTDTKLVQTNLQASVQGGLLALPAGELRFAAGAEYRRNSYDFSPDPLLVNLDLVNAQATSPSHGATEVGELYVELLAPLVRDQPLVQELNLDVAYRYSDYDSIGGVHTYKASLDWKPAGWLRVRGGYQRAIRAPNVGELFTAPTPSSEALGNPGAIGVGDPCDVRSQYRSAAYAGSAQVRQLCLAQGVPAALIDNYRNTNSRTNTASQGNLALREETADTYSVGAVLRPSFENPWLSRTSLSVDYYKITLEDAIGSVTGLLTVSKCFNADGSNPTYDRSNYFCSQLARESASGLISVINTPVLNLGGYKTSGIDAQLDWRMPVADMGLGDLPGAVLANVLASYLIDYKIQNLPNSPFREFAGTMGNAQIDPYADTRPTWKLTTTLGYEVGPVAAFLQWRYIDGQSNAANVGTTGSTRGVKSRHYFDLSGRWAVRENLDLAMGVNNLMDESPPLFGVTPGTTSLSTYDLIGRRYYARLTARF